MKRLPITLLGALALVTAGCAAQSPSPTTTEASQPVASPAESASEEPTEEATATAEESQVGELPSFDLPQSAPELAALLPDEIGGTQALKFSMSGEEMMTAGGDEVDPEFMSFLERLGAQPEDVSFAIAASTAADATLAAFAFRVEGADSTQLESEFQAAMSAQQEVTWTSASIGGKEVMTAEDPDTPGNAMYVYTRDDVIFIVTAPGEDEAAQVLSELP